MRCLGRHLTTSLRTPDNELGRHQWLDFHEQDPVGVYEFLRMTIRGQPAERGVVTVPVGIDSFRALGYVTGYLVVGRVLLSLTGDRLHLRGLGMTCSVVVSEVESGEVVGSFQLPPMTRSSVPDPWLLTTMTAIADTRQLVTATPGGQLVTRELPSEAWTRTACAAAGRTLTPAEWQRHVGAELPDTLACSPT